MTAPICVAVDPGSKNAGLVVRRGDELVDHLLLVRHPDCTLPQWVDQVCHAFIDLYRQSWRAGPRAPRLLAACEEAVPPTPHMGLTNVLGILETAHVVGALMHTFGKELILVPPGRHGTGPLSSFPPELVGPREKAGRGVLSHARSAWSIAAAAADMARIEQATG